MSNQWPLYSLGERITLLSGGTPSKGKPEYWEGDIPWVSCKDMKVSRLYDAEDHLSVEGATNGTRLVPANTILIVVRGMILAKEFPVALTVRETAFNQDLKAVLPASDELDNHFLYYWLKANTREILGIVDEAAHGTTRIQTDRLLSLPLYLPPLDIQCSIASILSAYDDLIENNTQRIAALEAAAQALYREWFVEMRFPNHESVRWVESEMGVIPEGWKIQTLSDHISIDKGISHKGEFLTPDGLPLVNLKNVYAGGGFRRDGMKYYSGEYKPRHTVIPGDLIVANTDLTQAGSVIGSPAIVPPLPTPSDILFSHHIYAVRFHENSILTRYYLFNLLRGYEFKSFAKGRANGTTVLGLSRDGVVDFSFICPPAHLIQRFEHIVEPMYEAIESYEQRNATLRETRDLLLPRLISGEVSVEGIGIGDEIR